MKPRTFHCYDICKLPFICPNKLFVTCIQLGSISLTTYKGALFSLLGKELKHNNATHTQTRAHLFPVWKLSLFPHHKTKTACLNLKFHIIETDPCLLRQWSGYFSWGVHKWKGASSWGGWECWRSGWERKRQRCLRGFSTSKLPAVNQRSRPSPGAALSSNPGGGKPPQGKKKNTTKQMQRAAGQCVSMYVCVIFLHACGF